MAFSHGPALWNLGGQREVTRDIRVLRPSMSTGAAGIVSDHKPKVVYDTMEKTVGRTPMVRLVRMDKEGEARGNVLLAKVGITSDKFPVNSRTNQSHGPRPETEPALRHNLAEAHPRS